MRRRWFFVFGVGYFVFCFILCFVFSMDDLTLNDMTVILGNNMDASVSIEIHEIYGTISFDEKLTNEPI
jgi:hypothetical protein